MACQVLLEMRIKDGCHDRLKQRFVELLPGTRAYDGCISIYLTRDLDDPAKIIIVELWETRGHYERYLQWRTDTGVMADLGTMIENPSWRFLEMWGV